MGRLAEMAANGYIRAFFKIDQLSGALSKGRAADVIPTIMSYFANVSWASAPSQLWRGYLTKHASGDSIMPLYHMIGLIMIGGVYREAAHLEHEVHELHIALSSGMPLKKDPFNQYPQGSPERKAFERHG